MPVLRGAHACFCAEQVAEPLRVLKSQRIGNAANAVRRVEQVVLGFFDQEEMDVL